MLNSKLYKKGSLLDKQAMNLAIMDTRTLAVLIKCGDNLVAVGGDNSVAAGGRNLVAAGGHNLVAAGVQNQIATGGHNLVAADDHNLVAAGGHSLVAAGPASTAVILVAAVLLDPPVDDLDDLVEVGGAVPAGRVRI